MTFRDQKLVLAQMEDGDGVVEWQGPSTSAERQAWEELSRLAQEMAERLSRLEQVWQDRVSEGVGKAQQTLFLFRRLVHKHALRERNVGFYARSLQLSPHYLCALVRKTSGQTVMDWINREVTAEARRLLGSGERPIQEVARELHFPDHASFTKFFKREVGLTPQAFRAGKSSSQS